MDIKHKKIRKLILLLSQKEEKRFKLFLKSPYFIGPHHQISLSRLFDFLLDEIKRRNVDSIDESRLAQLIFNDELVVPGKINKFLSLLQKNLLKFIGLESIQKSESIGLAAASELRMRGAANLWKIQVKKLEKAIKQDNSESFLSTVDYCQLAQEKYYFQNLKSGKTQQDSFLDICNAFDSFYIANLLPVGIRLLASNNFTFPVGLETRFEAMKMLMAQESNGEKKSSAFLKEQAFQLLNNLDQATKEDIDDFLELLIVHKKKTPHPIYTYLRYVARSLIIHLCNSGNTSLEELLFKMYKEDIEDESIFYNSRLPASTLNNMTTLCLRIGEIEWINNFIEDQKNNILEKETADFVIALNQSKILFSKRLFQGTLDRISFDAQDFFLKSQARILELMAYYELKSDQLAFKIESYKVYIFRIPKNRVSKRFISGHNNFIDIMKSICHPKTAFSQSRIQRIKTKIEKTALLAEKEWLLEKVNEF